MSSSHRPCRAGGGGGSHRRCRRTLTRWRPAPPRWWSHLGGVQPHPGRTRPRPWVPVDGLPPGAQSKTAGRAPGSSAGMGRLEMSAPGRHSTRTRGSVSTVTQTVAGWATRPTRLCFIVEEKYENDVMPAGRRRPGLLGTRGGHPAPALHADRRVGPPGEGVDDALVLKTVSSGPGLSILEAGRRGVPRSTTTAPSDLARDKAVAASRARRPAYRSPPPSSRRAPAFLAQVPRAQYPLVIKPNNGDSCEQICGSIGPEELEHRPG